MTDYPSIKPEDVREGDVVEVVHQLTVDWQLARTIPHLADNCYTAGVPVPVAQLRLISRPTPPEPPLRVGDWVRHTSGVESQLTPDHPIAACTSQGCARIEPPVGWPVGVPTEDGGTVWWSTNGGNGRYWCHDTNVDDHLSWADLLAAGGVPALAVTR